MFIQKLKAYNPKNGIVYNIGDIFKIEKSFKTISEFYNRRRKILEILAIFYTGAREELSILNFEVWLALNPEYFI